MAIKKIQCNKAPRFSWDYYAITKERYTQLKEYIRSGRYNTLVISAADEVNNDIAEYILLSVMENKTYEDIEYMDGVKRIPYGRTDFYGYRRLFYHIFNEKMKKAGK